MDAASSSDQAEDAGERPAEIEEMHSHRVLPILSGLLCPFALLLEIPGLTQRWYVREEMGVVVETQANSVILNVGLVVSIVFAIAANVSLILRFLERKPRLSTLISIGCLLVHDVVNVVILGIFGVVYSVDDGFTYGEPFYMTIAATVVSVLCSGTLVADFYQTPDFKKNGSGLSEKQRLLVIVVMVLLVYLALGSMAFSFMLELTFITSMYFVLVTISSTGYGDIVPRTLASQIFSFFYDTVGLVLVALTIAIGRETVIEGFERSYRRRRDMLAERVRERRIERQERFQRRRDKRRTEGSILSRRDERGNEGSLVSRFMGGGREEEESAGVHHHRALSLHRELDNGVATHRSRWSRFLHRIRRPLPGTTPKDLQSTTDIDSDLPRTVSEQSDASQEQFISFRNRLEQEKTREFRVKLAVALALFAVFWIVGAVVFKQTEAEWGWFEAFFFCYVTFTTIGYGPGPTSLAGRSFWVCYALFGIAVMTILLSVLTESWTKNFRTAIVTGRATRTAQQLSRQTISQTPSLASPLPALENLPRHTLDAVRSFDAHARYFINGRQGEIPEELQALLSTADEFDAAFDGFREGGELSAEQGDEQRRDRGHYLFLVSYERSLDNVKKSLESTERLFLDQSNELTHLRKINADLHRELDSRDVFNFESSAGRSGSIDDQEVEKELVAELDRESEAGDEIDDDSPPAGSSSFPPTGSTVSPSLSSTNSPVASSSHCETPTTALLHRHPSVPLDDTTNRLQPLPSVLLPLDSSVPSRTDLIRDSISMTTLSSPPSDPVSAPTPTASSQSITRRPASTGGLGMASRTSTITFLEPVSNR